MTLADFQPHVERAVTALEWATARARWRAGLLDERVAIVQATALAGQYGVEREPLDARLAQIDQELTQDVTADRVPVHPIRSVPMDLITAEVVRRLFGLPQPFPILSIKTLPSQPQIAEAVAAIASRWQTPNGSSVAVA